MSSKETIIIIATIIFTGLSFYSTKTPAAELNEMCRSDCKYEVKILKQYAKEGSSLAEFSLAIMYYRGVGVKRNIKVANRLLAKSAKAGEPGAQYQLGYFLMYGMYMDKDLERAKMWFKRASLKSTLDSTAKINEINEILGENIQPSPVVTSSTSIEPYGSIREMTNENIEKITIVLNSDYDMILRAANSQTCTHKSCDIPWTSVLAPLIKLKN